jgi:U3 small nucleolar RNA-associated protein 22
LKFLDKQLNGLLSLPTCIIENYGTGEERLEDINLKLDEFSKILKSLKDLPLSINKVYGISPAFRLTDVFAPLPFNFKYDSTSEKNMRHKKDNKYLPKYPLGSVMVPYLKPLEVCVNLESSGKWPDNLKCIKRLKAAFYIKIVQSLREMYGLQAFAFVDYLDVFYKGFVFRLYVYTMNELLLMKTSVNEQGVRVLDESEQSFAYEKSMLLTPKITSFVQA